MAGGLSFWAVSVSLCCLAQRHPSLPTSNPLLPASRSTTIPGAKAKEELATAQAVPHCPWPALYYWDALAGPYLPQVPCHSQSGVFVPAVMQFTSDHLSTAPTFMVSVVV